MRDGWDQHPDVIKTVIDTINKVGAGSGGTRNISGNAHHHILLEKAVAHLHSKERGLVFTSAYNAVVGVITAIVDGMRDCIIISEDHPHPSILHGVRLAKAAHQTVPRGNLLALEEALKGLSVNRPKLLIFPSFSSEDQSFLSLEAICTMAQEYGAFLVLDESDALGKYGPKGGGYAQQLSLEDKVPLIIGTFAGVFAGMGGYIASSDRIADYIRSFASGFIFTTSLPPSLAMGSLKAIELAQSTNEAAA